MQASTISAATALISRRLLPDEEPPEARRTRLAALAELALWVAIAIVRAIVEALAAICAVVLVPIDWVCDRLTRRRAPTATEFAEAIVEDAPPIEHAYTRPATPAADLVETHVRIRERGWRDLPTPAPLPPDVEAWYRSLTGEQRRTAGVVDKVKLERWIAACRAGSTSTGPGGLPPIRPLPVLPHHVYPSVTGKGGAASKGGVRAEPSVAPELGAALAEFDLDLGCLIPAPAGPRLR